MQVLILSIARGENADLIFTGDAVKNQAELITEQVDMTLDTATSQASIRRLKALASEDPSNLVICGHDHLLGLDGGKIVYRSDLHAAVRARLSSEFERETVIDLVQDGSSVAGVGEANS